VDASSCSSFVVACTPADSLKERSAGNGKAEYFKDESSCAAKDARGWPGD
jgi:hypothetical protein